MDSIKQIRKIFPHTSKKTYLNCASNGPLPNPAYKLQDEQFKIARMASIDNQSEIFEAVDSIRKKAARIFGCDNSEAGFGFNTTFGLNLAAFGLPLKKGDEVILLDVEFPANVYPWLELKKRGIKIKFIKSINGFFDIDNLLAAITSKTKVLSVSFVQFFNGYKNDLKTLGEICRKKKMFFVVDTIQGAGCESMRLKDWGVDIASAGGQKWLLSSRGNGIFYVSKRIQKKLIPPWRSWLSVEWKNNWSNLRNFKKPFPETAKQFEMGTYPGALVIAFEWSLDYLLTQGIKNIQKHNHHLIDNLIDYLESEPYYKIVSSLENKHRSSILSFTNQNKKIDPVYKYLGKKKIVTSLREGAIRISVHLFNSENDIRKLITALKECVPK